MPWLNFLIAMSVFFLSHSLPLRPGIRPVLVAALGARGFGLAYSAVSVAVIAWLISAAGRAPYVALWPKTTLSVSVTWAAMFLACLVLGLSIRRPNPMSFGGRRDAHFDPDNPGLVGLIRHPVLLALALWSGSHLLANGDLAHALLFSIFLVFSLAGRRLVDRRKRRQLGPSWSEIDRHLRARGVRARDLHVPGQTTVRVAISVLMFAALVWAHPRIIGVSPIAW